jgi:nitrite reductase/ring-hydroxylating ferredoxin subunit
MIVANNEPCAATCALARGRFLRSAGLAALASIGGVALLADPAFAQSMGSIAPSQSRGRLLTYAIPGKDGALVDAANGVVLARVNNAVYAMSIACPHRAVTTLEWMPAEREFHCPKHDAHFQSDGALIDGRPDRGMDRFAVHRSGRNVVVDTASLLQQDADRTAWNGAAVTAG